MMFRLAVVIAAFGCFFGAGPLQAAAATRLRCLQGCQCEIKDMEESRFVSYSPSERRDAHLNVRCTRGHNITLNKFFATAEILGLDVTDMRELSLEGLLIPTLRLSDFSRFPLLVVLNLPLNRVSKLVLKPAAATTPAAVASKMAEKDDGSEKTLASGFNVSGEFSRRGEASSVADNNLVHFCSRLLSLNLRDNSVSRLDDSVLKQLVNLKSLDLSSNNLHLIADNSFFANSQLEKLILKDNFITIVPRETFHYQKSLQLLDLSRNQIFSLHEDALFLCLSLRHVDLGSNLLSHLPRSLFEALPNSTRVSIQNNPLQCACGIEWLLQLLDQRKSSFENRNFIRCASPPFLADRALNSLRYDNNNNDNDISQLSNFTVMSELPCDEPDIRILGLSGPFSRTLPGSLYESLFGSEPLDLPPIKETTVVFVRDDAEFDCVVPPGIWPRPSILWTLPSGVQMAALPHAHHIPQALVDASNVTDSKTILMKPLDSEHSVTVIPPGLLRLTDFRYPMVGNYTCTAISPGGNFSASFRVHIQSAIWPTYISSLFISFVTVAISIVIASAVGLVVLLVTHFENKKLASIGLDGTPPIYPTPAESPQVTHKLLTIPVNAAMFENMKDGYDSFRSKVKTGLDKRMEKGRLLVELAWVSGETAFTGIREGTSTSIHKIDHVVRESGVALTRGIRSGGAAVNKSIRESGAVVTQAVYESVSAVKDNVLSLKELCGGVPSTAGSICGELPNIDFIDANGGGGALGLENPAANDDVGTATIEIHSHPAEDQFGGDAEELNTSAATNFREWNAEGERKGEEEGERKTKSKYDGKIKSSRKLQPIAEDGDGGARGLNGSDESEVAVEIAVRGIGEEHQNLVESGDQNQHREQIWERVAAADGQDLERVSAARGDVNESSTDEFK